MDQLMEGLTTLVRIVAIGLPSVIWVVIILGLFFAIIAWLKEKFEMRDKILFGLWTWFQHHTKIAQGVLFAQAFLMALLMFLYYLQNLLWLLWLNIGLACLVLGEISFLGYLVFQKWPTDEAC